MGSAMVAVGSSKEEVLEALKSDIYAKNGVWDFEKVDFLSCWRCDMLILARFKSIPSSVRSGIHEWGIEV